MRAFFMPVIIAHAMQLMAVDTLEVETLLDLTRRTEKYSMTHKLASLLFTGLLLPMLVQAAELSISSRQEIDLLLEKLGNSSCEFYRNGAWHDSSKAQAHLQRKLAYLIDKHQVGSAEEFIEIGASRSSISGKPYLVRCDKQPEIRSDVWLQKELDSIRMNAAARTVRKN